MFVKWIFVPLFLLISTGLAGAEVKVNNHPFELGSQPVFKAGPDGLYFGYYSKSEDNALYIKRLDTDIDKETAITAEDMRGQHVDLSFVRDGMLLTWRPKKGDGKKYIYVQRSEDGGRTFKKPVVINSTTDALLPITTATDGKERLYVVWLDERDKHRLYMNYSLDGGRSFLKEDILLTPDFVGANLPRLLIKNERVDLFFIGVKAMSKQGIYHRYSSDGGRTWSEINTVEDSMDWGPFTLMPVRSGDNILVFWAGVEGLHGAYSKDGRTWNKIEFKETAGKDVNRLDVQSHGSGIYIVTSYQTRLAVDEKPNIYFYRSLDGGSAWAGPKKLNTNEYNSTSSVFPVMGMGSDGRTILAAWQDHRDIRGSIYINYSRDGGDTWLKEDRLFEKEGGKYNSSYPFIVNHRDRFYMLWYRLIDDAKNDADLYMEEVKIK